MATTAPKINKSDASKVQRARRVAAAAVNEGAVIATDLRVNRSTRTRSAYKVKAEALDKVLRILAGKE
jgi:hypothetical protein